MSDGAVSESTPRLAGELSSHLRLTGAGIMFTTTCVFESTRLRHRRSLNHSPDCALSPQAAAVGKGQSPPYFRKTLISRLAEHPSPRLFAIPTNQRRAVRGYTIRPQSTLLAQTCPNELFFASFWREGGREGRMPVPDIL